MDTPILFMYLFFGAIGLIIFIWILYYFYRWIFSIKRQLWNQRQQLNILIGIAKKLEIDEDNLNEIYEMNNHGEDSKL